MDVLDVVDGRGDGFELRLLLLQLPSLWNGRERTISHGRGIVSSRWLKTGLSVGKRSVEKFVL